jgi:hypothetical protein
VRLLSICFAFSLVTSCSAFAQQGPDPRTAPKATVIRAETIYLQGDTGSDKLGTIEPGREMAILKRSGHWLNVYANIDTGPAQTEDQPVFGGEPDGARPDQPISGWIEDMDVVEGTTLNGQSILFGVGVSDELAASAVHPVEGAALEAMRMYRMAVELFPKETRTAEAMWRAADIRWQLQKEDASTLPSAHEKENYLREQPNESEMRMIEKLYPGSQWAGFAAFDMVDNKLCGDWQGSEQCPEKEAGYYQQFADQYPDSPRAPHALYEAAWRLACAGDMWAQDNNQGRSTDDRNHAVVIAQHLAQKYPGTDYAAQAQALEYKVDHGVPIYGSDRK